MIGLVGSIGGEDMDDKVSISIEKIENGYLLHRSWTEKGDKDTEYHSEEHFFKELPESFAKYMVKGKLSDEPVKDFDEADDRADFRLNNMKEDKKDEKKDDKDEEDKKKEAD